MHRLLNSFGNIKRREKERKKTKIFEYFRRISIKHDYNDFNIIINGFNLI